MKKIPILSGISTMPSKNALKWAGKEYSILSGILLWSLWICRVLSLLQILKFLYRSLVSALHRGSTDKKSARPNIPPMFCEFYYMAWAAFLMLTYFLKWDGPWVRAALHYYLFESIVWVLYYTVFRRFFEENYSIYHELEYLTVLMLVIPSQALDFASIYSLPFSKLIVALLGAGGDDIPAPVGVIGALFAAIVISMIITAFPAERVKRSKKKNSIYIIGNGDVVVNRLYPALLDAGISENEIRILDLGEEQDSTPHCRLFPTEAALTQALCRMVDDKSIVFIATPTGDHVRYLKALLKSKAGLIAMEKPIACTEEDLDYVSSLFDDSETRSRIFFLSYYILEKALPLQYLTTNNTHYLKYLDVEDPGALHNWRLRLGPLKSASVTIAEGEDTREWVYREENGGQLLETFLHNVLVASLLCGSPAEWRDVKLTESRKSNTLHIDLSATVDHTAITLHMAKNAPPAEQKREASFLFGGGSIHADFDKRSIRVYFADIDRSISVATKDCYAVKYRIQTELVKASALEEHTASEVDGLKHQIATLKWLLALHRAQGTK